MKSVICGGLFCLAVLVGLKSYAQQADTASTKSKVVETVDFKSNKTVTVTYKDGSSETMSETEAHKKGLIHNGGYGNYTANAAPGGGNRRRGVLRPCGAPSQQETGQQQSGGG